MCYMKFHIISLECVYNQVEPDDVTKTNNGVEVVQSTQDAGDVKQVCYIFLVICKECI